MKRILLSIAVLLGFMTGNAQEKYKISGKIEGFPDGSLFLISDEKSKPDTLEITRIVNGTFEFTGKVTSPTTAYIALSNQKGRIPLILENTEFVINGGKAGVTIKGGIQQEIYKQFGAINMAILQKQEKIQQELKVAEQEKDRAKIEALATQFNRELAIFQAKEKELLQKYADTYVAAHVVATGMRQIELEALKARYAMLGPSAKESFPGLAVAALITQQEKLSVGNIAPDFTVKTYDGGAIALKDTKGKVKLIDFWASWCAPCRQENINLLRLYQKYHTKGLEIISISLDDNKSSWMNASAEDGIVWENGSELKGQDSEVARLYFVREIPHSLLLDENNVIIAKNLKGDALRKKIVEILKK